MKFEDNTPVYSGKQIVSGDRRILSSNRSFLLRNRMMDVSTNHLLLQIESKSRIDSIMRFCKYRQIMREIGKTNKTTGFTISTYHLLVFGQDHVVLGHSNTENNRRNTFETVNPFLALRSLAADIEHSVTNSYAYSRLQQT